MEQPSNKLAFTICSANYLAQAIALGDSLLQHNPRYTFIIGLVDEISDHKSLPVQISYPLIPIKDINISNKEGNYFLSWACANDDLDVVKYFLENGADINIEGKNKYTPLHFAYANGHFRIIALLEKKGANQRAKDNDGREPWQHFALYLLGGSLDCK